jgi:glucose 1-dehydrogenase
VALITGASQGIGQGIAMRFAQEGADIIVNDRNQQAADKVAETIRETGRRAIGIQADVSSVSQVQAMVDQAVKQFGRVDVLVNNAGVERRAPFEDVTEADYEIVMNVNLKGAFFTAQAVVRQMIAGNLPGRIINISSVHEDLPFPHFTAYCASKGGMKMMMRNLAIELAPKRITVNNIAPGAIETPINSALMNDPKKLGPLLENIPLGRLGTPKDVASVAVFLASDESDYVTGTTIVVDGGLTWNYSEQ